MEIKLAFARAQRDCGGNLVVAVTVLGDDHGGPVCGGLDRDDMSVSQCGGAQEGIAFDIPGIEYARLVLENLVTAHYVILGDHFASGLQVDHRVDGAIGGNVDTQQPVIQRSRAVFATIHLDWFATGDQRCRTPRIDIGELADPGFGDTGHVRVGDGDCRDRVTGDIRERLKIAGIFFSGHAMSHSMARAGKDVWNWLSSNVFQMRSIRSVGYT